MSKQTSENMSIYNHLLELRRVLIVSLAAIVAAAICVYAFALQSLLRLLTGPLTNLGLEPIIIGVTEGFIVRIKVAIFAGLMLSIPIILWQLLRFVLPALYPHEKKAAFLSVISGALLFAAGVCFSFKFILEIALKVMLFDFAGGLAPMISFSKYISFIMMILFPFGLVFEIPLIAVVLTRIGLLSPAFMRKQRKMVVFSSFVVAAFLTPPDVFSQVLLAVPMIALYEVGILVSSAAVKRRDSNAVESAAE